MIAQAFKFTGLAHIGQRDTKSESGENDAKQIKFRKSGEDVGRDDVQQNTDNPWVFRDIESFIALQLHAGSGLKEAGDGQTDNNGEGGTEGVVNEYFTAHTSEIPNRGLVDSDHHGKKNQRNNQEGQQIQQ